MSVVCECAGRAEFVFCPLSSLQVRGIARGDVLQQAPRSFAKVDVESSNLFSRSKNPKKLSSEEPADGRLFFRWGTVAMCGAPLGSGARKSNPLSGLRPLPASPPRGPSERCKRCANPHLDGRTGRNIGHSPTMNLVQAAVR